MVLRPVRQLVHSKVDVAVVSTLVLPAAEARVYVLLANDGDADMYLRIGGAAVANEGIPLRVGGSYEMSIPYGNISALEINACHIGPSKTRNLLVLEGHNR